MISNYKIRGKLVQSYFFPSVTTWLIKFPHYLRTIINISTFLILKGI